MLVANENTYRKLSQFESIEKLNEAVKAHRRNHSEELNKTTLEVLDVLSRHSCKYIGVSFLTKSNIGKMIGKSRRTIIRACQRLEALGIIRQYELRRESDGQQTSNAIVILPVETADVTQESTENVTPKNSESLNSKNIILNNTYQADKPRRQSPYNRFKSFVENFVNDRKLTNRLYGIYLAQTKPLKHAFNAVELLEIALDAVKAAFMATKRKYNPVTSVTGYFNNTLDRMLDDLYFEEMADFYEEF
jgi:DNA-binding Lrp family transcriptional regulator